MIHSKLYIPQYDETLTKYNDGQWEWENKAFTRITSLIEFRKMIKELGISSDKMLVMNGEGDSELEFITKEYVSYCNYVSNPDLYDLHTMDLDDKDFDFVICNQTIEHLYNPFVSVKNINSHMKMDGYFYATVPVNNMPHDTPIHFYTGFTAVGFGALVEECGFEVVKLGQWGNFEYLEKMFVENKWADYRQVSWKNDVTCPIDCWVLAKKVKDVCND